MLRICFDGASRGNPGRAALGVHCTLAIGARRVTWQYAHAFGVATNNVAEFRACRQALRAAHAMVSRRDLAVGAECVELDSAPIARDALKHFLDSSLKSVSAILLVGDSKLVVCGTQGQWRIKAAGLLALHAECAQLWKQLRAAAVRSAATAELRHVPRARNALADAAANRALDRRTPPASAAADAKTELPESALAAISLST